MYDVMLHSKGMREAKDVQLVFRKISFHTSLDFLCLKSCSLHSIWSQFHSPACSQMVYTFSRMFIRCTFLQLVSAKHTVRIWIRQRSVEIETAQCKGALYRNTHIHVRTFI